MTSADDITSMGKHSSHLLLLQVTGKVRKLLPCRKTLQHIVLSYRSALTVISFSIDKGSHKGKVFPYSLPSIGPGADPGVQAVNLQVTLNHPPSGRLPLLSASPEVTSVAFTRWCHP